MLIEDERLASFRAVGCSKKPAMINGTANNHHLLLPPIAAAAAAARATFTKTKTTTTTAAAGEIATITHHSPSALSSPSSPPSFIVKTMNPDSFRRRFFCSNMFEHVSPSPAFSDPPGLSSLLSELKPQAFCNHKISPHQPPSFPPFLKQNKLFLLLIALVTCFLHVSSAYDASYSVVPPVRSSHICFLRPTLAREDRVALDRWFFNTTSRKCEGYQLELNAIDRETRRLLNDFASYRSCYRFCYRVVKNLTLAEVQDRVQEARLYYSPPSRAADPGDRLMASSAGKPSPGIVVSNVDAKSRREDNTGRAPPQSRSSNNNRREEDWASTYKSRTSKSASSLAASCQHQRKDRLLLLLLLSTFFFYKNN